MLSGESKEGKLVVAAAPEIAFFEIKSVLVNE